MSKLKTKVPSSVTNSIAFPAGELRLAPTLNGGQSFRWVELDDKVSYRGVFAQRVWTLKQTETHLCYTVHGPLSNDPGNERILSRYLRRDVSLKANMKLWSAADRHFEKVCKTVGGVRILDQDVVENLFSFICSSNNNIARISTMVEKLCRFFGTELCQVDDKRYHDFPTIQSLAGKNVVSILRAAGFGYRAGYIANTARRLLELGGESWLETLRKDANESYAVARGKLETLPGIGPKVADCICLMSLGYLEAIPVDTHIFQVARAIYMPGLETRKTVTPKIHNEVGTFLRKLWGPLAGWAQAVVFCAKLDAKLNDTDERLRKKKRRSDENVGGVQNGAKLIKESKPNVLAGSVEIKK